MSILVIDVGTSGLLVVARTALAYDTLVAALSSRSVGRVYRTLVWGYPPGLITTPTQRPTAPCKRSISAPSWFDW